MKTLFNTLIKCQLKAINGRTIWLYAIRESERITFSGGEHGNHSITSDSSNERIKAHFKGYCENRANNGLWSITYFPYI